MSFAATLGLGNDPSIKELRKLNRNFQQLFILTNSHHKRKEKFIEKQDNLIRRLMQTTSKQYDDSPIVGNGGQGVLKDIEEDDNKLLALILGGGLIAGALMMGHSILDSLGGFFDDVKDKVVDELGLEEDDSSPGSSTPSSTPSSPSTPSTPSAPATISPADDTSSGAPGPVNPGRQAAFTKVYNIAKKVGGAKFPEAVAAQAMHETGYLGDMGVYKATGYTNAFGQTGDRGWGTVPRAGFSDGWSKYPSLEESVRDHIKLWHSTSRHKDNYNAHNRIIDGIAAVAPVYSPNSDPANIRLGYTTDGYSKGMVQALRMMGYDPMAVKKKQTGGLLGQAGQAMKNLVGLGKGKTDKGGVKAPDFSKSPLKGNYLTAYQEIKRHFPEAQPHHIAAAMGNFDTEAPGIRPNTYQGSQGKPIPGKPGRGIAQWEVPSKKNPTGRWAVAEKMFGKEVFTSLKKQLEFFAWEMKTGAKITEGPHKGKPNLPKGNNAKGMWLDAPDLHSATMGFLNGYEAPSIPHTEKRMKNATRIHQQILQHQKMFPGHKSGGFVMPKAKTPKINIKTEPKAKLQRGGLTSADRLQSLHTDSYVGSLQKRRHSRSVIVVKTETRLIPTLQPQEWERSIHGTNGSTYNPATVAKTMYRVQKGAFT